MFSILGAALAGLIGCATVGTVQTAETLGAGAYEVALEPSVAGAGSGGEASYWPSVGVSGRYGVTDGVDVGARVSASGLALGGRFALRGPEDGVTVVLAPSVGGRPLVGYGELSLPLLVGVPMRGGDQLVLGPKLYSTWWAGDRSLDIEGFGMLWGGGTVGYAARVVPGLRLLPELGLALPIAGGEELYGAIEGPPLMAQFSVGVLHNGRL